jgi:hypothetical protein
MKLTISYLLKNFGTANDLTTKDKKKGGSQKLIYAICL